MFLWSVLLCWSVAVLMMWSPREILRPEFLQSGVDHNSAEIPGKGQTRGPLYVILRWTYRTKKILFKLKRMKVKTVERSQVTTVSKIQGTVLTACWADFCRPGSSCSEDMSLFALVCRSAAGRRRTCARLVPACSCWSPRGPGSRGSPWKRQRRRKKKQRKKSENIYFVNNLTQVITCRFLHLVKRSQFNNTK